MIAFPTNTSSPTFLRDLDTYSKQQHQDAVNKLAHDEYVPRFVAWVAQNTVKRDMGQPLDPPLIPPKMVTWHDDGTPIESSFPDLKIANEAALPPATLPPDRGVLFGHTGTEATQDQKLDAIIQLLMILINRK